MIEDITQQKKTLFTGGLKYFRNWLIFSILAVILTQPVINANEVGFLYGKFLQIIAILPYAFITWITFTILQNLFNKKRNNKITWVFIIFTWMICKFIIFAFNQFIS